MIDRITEIFRAHRTAAWTLAVLALAAVGGAVGAGVGHLTTDVVTGDADRVTAEDLVILGAVLMTASGALLVAMHRAPRAIGVVGAPALFAIAIVGGHAVTYDPDAVEQVSAADGFHAAFASSAPFDTDRDDRDLVNAPNPYYRCVQTEEDHYPDGVWRLKTPGSLKVEVVEPGTPDAIEWPGEWRFTKTACQQYASDYDCEWIEVDGDIPPDGKPDFETRDCTRVGYERVGGVDWHHDWTPACDLIMHPNGCTEAQRAF